jgi:2,3-dihydroxyphenylpropionate 1,2-dioxygenase
MSMALICFSHSPLQLDHVPPADAQAHDDWQRSVTALDDWVRDYDPELIAVFYPDHFNGFFYRTMPSFCIGTAARGGIDWGIEPGPLDVPADVAQACIAAVRNADIDVTLSHRMLVDHGVTLPLNLFGGGLTARPCLPIMVNCNAPPYPSFRRVRGFGEAVGKYLASLDQRVLVVGSGGLSHDPPNAGPAMFESGLSDRLIDGGEQTKADYDRRQARVIQAGRDLGAGGRPCLPPDADWDRAYMNSLLADDLEAYDDADDDALSAVGGVGVHEVRAWTAAFAAMRAAGPYRATIDCYHAVPEWLTGMGIMRATAEPPA